MKKNYDEIHWWQFPLNKISIKLEPEFKNRFFELTYNYFSSSQKVALFIQKKTKKYNRRITTDYRIIWHYKTRAKYIPAWIIYEISKKIGFDMEEIEKNIVSYISSSGRIVIYNPKLPIKVTPEFSAIAIHIMCDGSESKGKFHYHQKRKEELNRFIRSVKNTFGNYSSKNYKITHRIPTIVSLVVSDYYKINTFLSMKCRIQRKMFSESKNTRVAVLLAALHDDGNVCGAIRFFSSNKRFLQDLRKIGISLGYKCTDLLTQKIVWKMKYPGYSFKIRASSVENFLKDTNELIKKFPDMHIGRKLDSINKFVNYRKRSWKQRKIGETKSIMINSLKLEPKTAYELQDITNTALWTTYHHLQQLIKSGKVQKYKEGVSFKYTLSS